MSQHNFLPCYLYQPHCCYSFHIIMLEFFFGNNTSLSLSLSSLSTIKLGGGNWQIGLIQTKSKLKKDSSS